MTALPPEVGQVEVLRIRPGDVLIVHMDRIPSSRTRQMEIEESVQRELNLPPGVKVVFAKEDIQFQVITTAPDPDGR